MRWGTVGIAMLLGVAGCTGTSTTSHSRPTPSSSPVPRKLAPATAPVGWHRVAHLSFFPSHPNDSRVGSVWTAKSTVRWVMQCETVSGAASESVILETHLAARLPKSMSFSPSSPGWLECPLGVVATKRGTFAVPTAKPGGRGHDVDMMLDSAVGHTDALTDGSVIYRVDAFEKRRA